jgi:hypothetical protein
MTTLKREEERGYARAIADCRQMQPFELAPRDGSWIIAFCNDHSQMFRVSWRRDQDGHLAWCSTTKSYGDGIFLPFGAWIYCPDFPARQESTKERQ